MVNCLVNHGHLIIDLEWLAKFKGDGYGYRMVGSENRRTVPDLTMHLDSGIGRRAHHQSSELTSQTEDCSRAEAGEAGDPTYGGFLK